MRQLTDEGIDLTQCELWAAFQKAAFAVIADKFQGSFVSFRGFSQRSHAAVEVSAG